MTGLIIALLCVTSFQMLWTIGLYGHVDGIRKKLDNIKFIVSKKD